MKRLLWKEFREQGVWGIIWAASLVGLGVWAHAQRFTGMSFSMIGLMIYVPLISAVVGAGAYSSELTGNRADFVCTRPIPWYQLLLAKMLFAAIIVFCSAAISSVMIRFTTPAPYLPFATPLSLLSGAVPLILMSLIGYFVGLCFSVTLPGIAGGVIALMSSILIVIIAGVASADVKGEHRIIYFWLIIGGLLGAIYAGVKTIRSRLTLPTRERVIRFACIYILFLSVMWLVRLVTPNDIISSHVPDAYQQAIFSPNAEYALMYVGHSQNIVWNMIPGGVDTKDEEYYKPTRAYIIRLSDRRLGRLPNEAIWLAGWTNDDTIVYSIGNVIHRIRMKPDGAIEDQSEDQNAMWRPISGGRLR